MNGLKYKTAEPKLKKNSKNTKPKLKLTKTIEREERKEKRVLMKMEECLDDRATRSMDAPR